MSSSPRNGGDPDEETDCSKRLRKGAPLPSSSNHEIDSRARVCEIVSEASSDQEQSNPATAREEKQMKQSHSPAGHQVNAGLAEEDAHELRRLPIVGGLSHTVPPPPPPPPPLPQPGPWWSRLRRPQPPPAPPPLPQPGPWWSRLRRPPPPLPSPPPLRRGRSRSLGYIPHLRIDHGALGLGAELPWQDRVSVAFSDQEGLSSGVETTGSHIVEIVGDMEDELPRQSKKVLVQKEMIYRVPEITRSLDKDAYARQFVSFGPYRRDTEQTLNMNEDVSLGTEALSTSDKYKWFYLEQILNMNKEVSLKMYLEEMNQLKQKVKGCYEEDNQMETKDGIKMLLLDGCCILGFLGILPLPPQEVAAPHPTEEEGLLLDGCCILGFLGILPLPPQEVAAPEEEVGLAAPHPTEEEEEGLAAPHPEEEEVGLAVPHPTEEEEVGLAAPHPTEEEVGSKRTADSARVTLWYHDSIRHDLLLMENQLPFFVLQKIYDLATAGTPLAGSLTLEDKVGRTIQRLLASYPLTTTKQSFHHLLHCCHLKFRPAMANSSSSNSNPTDELQPWRGAMDLYKAGIKFKPKQCDPSESLLDVKLVSGRTLMIPTLIIKDSTRSVFRNLIAFEQACTDKNYFAAYAFFMGELMRTPGDVTLLVKKGVVQNYLGADKEVSDFFNNLVKRVVFDVHGKHFLSPTFEELNRSYNNVGNKHWADLTQNYCRSPWVVIWVIVGAIALACTIVQTVLKILRR